MKRSTLHSAAAAVGIIVAIKWLAGRVPALAPLARLV